MQETEDQARNSSQNTHLDADERLTSLHNVWMSNVKSWHYYCFTPADQAPKTTTRGEYPTWI